MINIIIAGTFNPDDVKEMKDVIQTSTVGNYYREVYSKALEKNMYESIGEIINGKTK